MLGKNEPLFYKYRRRRAGMTLGPPPPDPPPPRRPPLRPRNEGSPEYVAQQVSGALRAAARGRRQRHEKPKDVVIKAFARFSEDGRLSPAEFVAGCERLGLTVPIADALAVFITAPSEFVMESDRDKENAGAGAGADGATNEEEGTEAGGAGKDDDADAVLLLYAPWIDDVLEGPPRTASRPREPVPTAPRVSTSGRTSPATSRPNRPENRSKTQTNSTRTPAPPPRRPSGYVKPVAPSERFRTRRGPLTEHDPPIREGDAFVYPHCRTPVFPPDGFDQTHLARGGVLPDATLELDHVHGCGPGLVDQAAPVPIFCIPPRADPKTGKVNKENEECVYYAAGVCVARTLRDPRAVLAERAAENAARDALAARRKMQYMAGVELDPVPLKSWEHARCQRHFRGHVDDVRCLTIHEGSRRCASGEMGAEPRAIVWRVDADVAEAPLAILKHGKGTRAVICVGFNADCTRLVTVCGDDGHTVSLWDWNAGPLVNASLPGGTRAGLRLWQSRGYQNTPPAVRGAMFTPDLERKDVLLTFGSKHIKFWTPPAREPRPPGGVGDADAERAFQKLPWRARSGQWVPNATVEDVLCAAFLPWVRAEEVSDADADDDDAASVVSGPPGEDNLARGVNLVTGSPKGRIMFWEKGDGAVPVKIVPGSNWHKAGVSALALSFDKRLLLSGDKAGGVMCWAMNTSYGTIVAPLGGVFLVENPPKPLPPTPPPSVSASEVWLEGDDEYPGPGWEYEGEPLRWLESYPDIRGASWSPSGQYALITTAQGSVWRILIDPKLTEGEETDTDETEDEDGSPHAKLTELALARLEYAAAVKENAKQPVVSVLIRGHDSSLNAAAWWQGGKFASSGTQAMFATGAGSGRTVIWNAWTRTEQAAFDAGGPVRSLAFSPDGHHLAVGLDKGTVNVFGVLAWKQPDPDYISTGDAWFNVEVRFLYACVGSLKASVGALGYSPDGRWLAAGDQLGGLELYRTKAKIGDEELRPAYSRRSKCSGHSSAVCHVDWTECSRCVRSGSTSYELLHHLVPSGQLLPRAPRYGVDSREPIKVKEKDTRKKDDDDSESEGELVDPTHDAHALLDGYESDDDGRGGWHTWTSPLGFEVMGVWREGQDGTDINEVWRSVDGKRLFSADDSGAVRVVNYPCVLAKAPSHVHRAHSSHVTAARGSWCDAWVASAGGRDCCVMQWRVVPAPTPTDAMEGYFETPRHAGLVGGVGTGITGFDLTDIDAGVVNLRVVDRPTARVVRGKAKKSKAKVKKVSSKESSEDDGDDGIWNAKREDDIVEMDEPLDLLADADAVVPVCKLKSDANVAKYAAEFVKREPATSKMWATREEVAERRRRLETELRKLGKERQATAIGGGPAAGRVEWNAPNVRGGEVPVQPGREPRVKFGPYQSEPPLFSHQKPFYYPPDNVSDAGTFSDAGDDA